VFVTTPHHIGILLAAGRGRRMGMTKQLLPWPPPEDAPMRDAQRDNVRKAHDQSNPPSPQPSPEERGRGQTVVAASFDIIAPHCTTMIVVLGHDADAIAEALQPRSFHEVRSDADAEMLHSIQLGLGAAQDIDATRSVLLHPADVPGVPRAIVQQIVEAAGRNPQLAVMPEFDGRGGHPVVIPAHLIGTIVDWSGEGGLRRYWAEHSDRRLRVPVDSRAVTQDLDSPVDYETR